MTGHFLPLALNMSAESESSGRICAFEEAMSATALGVDDTLGNTLTVEM